MPEEGPVRKTNTFADTAATGRHIIDMGDGTTLDTNTLLGGSAGYRGPVSLSGYSSGRATVERYGRVVVLVLYGAVSTATNPVLPTGYWPTNHILIGHSGMAASGPRYVVNAGTGEMSQVSIADASTLYLTAAWLTNQPLPNA